MFNSSNNAIKSASDVSTSAIQSADSAQTASQSAKNASDSAELAKTSKANAVQSATEAKNAVDSIDTSNFIKKSGEENQSISGSLNVDELKEKGKRVYSPNNKPSADDIGTLPATKTVVNDKTTYQVDKSLDFKVRPKFNNSELISKSDFSIKLDNPGFEIMPSGLTRQWGTVTLAPIGNYNAVKVDSILYYTNYYRILLPIAFPTCADSVNVILNCRAFNEQWSMFGLSATASLDGSPTMFTVAVLSSTFGFIPKISYEIIGH